MKAKTPSCSADNTCACADIPFQKAVAGVRVGWIDGKPVINPTVSPLGFFSRVHFFKGAFALEFLIIDYAS